MHSSSSEIRLDLRLRLTPVGRGGSEDRSCVTIQHPIGVDVAGEGWIDINQKEEKCAT
jgi:hypothetical protein